MIKPWIFFLLKTDVCFLVSPLAQTVLAYLDPKVAADTRVLNLFDVLYTMILRLQAASISDET